MRVHILDGMRRRNPNRLWQHAISHKHFFPIVLARGRLKDLGVEVRFVTQATGAALDCDVLFVSSRYFDELMGTRFSPAKRAEQVAALRAKVPRLVWFDLRDSSGTCQFEVMPHVDLYAKQFLLKDRTAYERPMYGGRFWSDYYHRRFDVDDGEVVSDDQEQDFTLLDPADQAKLAVYWDVSYDYLTGAESELAEAGVLLRDTLRQAAGGIIAPQFHAPETSRSIDVAAMLSTERYARATVAFQRRLALTTLEGAGRERMVLGKRPRKEFYETMRQAKVVVSCFGNGEVCYREHEAWTEGAAVVMADMGHVDVWPKRYLPGETYLPVAWDMGDLTAQIDRALSDEGLRLHLARSGQAIRKRMFSQAGVEDAALRVKALAMAQDPDRGDARPSI